VADARADRVLVFDLERQRLVRHVTLPGARPCDVVAQRTSVFVTLPGRGEVVRLTAHGGPWPAAAGLLSPERIATSPGGRLAVLGAAGSDQARVRFLGSEGPELPCPGATDLDFESDDVIVIAFGTDDPLRRVNVADGDDQRPLRAKGYDGRGIVATPEAVTIDGAPARRIGFFTAAGAFRPALPARVRYERSGRVTTYRLDGGDYQTAWGRVFVDACIPPGSEVRLGFLTQDEAAVGPSLAWTPPGNVVQPTIRRPDLSPMPLSHELAAVETSQRLHRRESGRELPWAQPPAGDRFVTYEAPVAAPHGRFLWIVAELRGDTRVTPQIRSVRAETAGHDYLRRLPRAFSREDEVASFLQRYLAIFHGFLGEVDARAVARQVLLDPRSTPDEALPWLASFLGMVLDERWAHAPSVGGSGPRDARRELIREAAWLFRFRGTPGGLRRFLSIYVGSNVVLVERFRLRGLGGVVLGEGTSPVSHSVLGRGLRVGGATEAADAGAAGEASIADAFRTHAHRFTVLLPATLGPEELDVVRAILDLHRPAHTLFDLCPLDAGMRVGRGLLLAVSSIVGRTSGFAPAEVGAARLGRGGTLGRPEPGPVLGAARLGHDGRPVDPWTA
jgi:phage tail-like protein